MRSGEVSPRASGGAGGAGLLRSVRSGALPQPGLRRGAARDRRRRRARGAVGPRRGHGPLRPRPAWPAGAAGQARTCSTRGASPARRARTCWSRRSWTRTAATRACTSCSRAADPSEERLRERVGEQRATFLGWLEGIELARAYASADIFLFPSRHRHLWPGDPRGAGQRPAGRGGRCGRPAVADRGPRQRPALQARAGRPGGGRARARRPPRCCAGVWPPSRWRRARRRTWEGAMERLAEGYRRAAVQAAHEGAHAAARSWSARVPRLATRRSRSRCTTSSRRPSSVAWRSASGSRTTAYDRVTLLVIPARDLHPLGERSPEMVGVAGRAPPRGRLDRPARLSARAAALRELAPAPAGAGAQPARRGVRGTRPRLRPAARWRRAGG